MTSHRKEASPAIDHVEVTISSPVPRQINAQRKITRKSSEEKENHNERSEVSLEVNGFREAALTPSKNVVTSTVRSVYRGSSSSGSSEGSRGSRGCTPADERHRLGSDEPEDVFSKNHKGGAGVGGPRERKTSSESHYISQTYAINSGSKANKSVSAVKNVRFKSSKRIELGSTSSNEDDGDLSFVDRLEQVMDRESPEKIAADARDEAEMRQYVQHMREEVSEDRIIF